MLVLNKELKQVAKEMILDEEYKSKGDLSICHEDKAFIVLNGSYIKG